MDIVHARLKVAETLARRFDGAKRTADGVVIEIRSGNVSADLELADAKQLKIKPGLVIEISRAVKRHGVTQEDARQQMGISQAKVSGLVRGYSANLTESNLMDCLNRLGLQHTDQAKSCHRASRTSSPRSGRR